MKTCAKVLISRDKPHGFAFETMSDCATCVILCYINEYRPSEPTLLFYTCEEASMYYYHLLDAGFVEGSLADIEKIKTRQSTNTSPQGSSTDQEYGATTHEQRRAEKFYDERLRHLEGWVRYLVESRYTGSQDFNFDSLPPEPLPRPDSWQPVEQAIPTKQPASRLSRGRAE